LRAWRRAHRSRGQLQGHMFPPKKAAATRCFPGPYRSPTEARQVREAAAVACGQHRVRTRQLGPSGFRAGALRTGSDALTQAEGTVVAHGMGEACCRQRSVRNGATLGSELADSRRFKRKLAAGPSERDRRSAKTYAFLRQHGIPLESVLLHQAIQRRTVNTRDPRGLRHVR
jgi:hypothetical protein